jgi:hypothetical protein
VLPGVWSLANAQTGNVASACPTRISRSAEPPASLRSNESSRSSVLPDSSFLPKSMRRRVKSLVRWLTLTAGLSPSAETLKPDVPGRTAR